MVWALVIIHGSALAPHLEIVSYVLTGIVAFLMCIQAKQLLLSFVPGTFIGACATFAGQGDWRLVLPSLALGLIFGYAMKNSGLWLASRREQHSANTAVTNKKAWGSSPRFVVLIRILAVLTAHGISPEYHFACPLYSANPTVRDRYHH
ncbi:hypothetical protein SEEH0318_14244 [Salmonella enterica subsp. enterica serovar Heidelberg str. 90-0318]|nr:hypothetical protein SEEH0318_14244 [Salmonella enterica subsp. enterica serovar Heidelberg str. 90-0318]